jgi:hypothetical protein
LLTSVEHTIKLIECNNNLNGVEKSSLFESAFLEIVFLSEEKICHNNEMLKYWLNYREAW